MNLGDWLVKLRSAMERPPIDPLFHAAQRAATRATMNSAGRFTFHVERTPAGAKITGWSLVGAPRKLGDDAVRRMLAPELERARNEVAAELRARLTS